LEKCEKERIIHENELEKLNKEIIDLETDDTMRRNRIDSMQTKLHKSRMAMTNLERIELIGRVAARKPSREADKARREYERYEREYQDAKNDYANRLSRDDHMKSEIARVNLLLPKLEAEKKVAVESRQFKEAGRLNAEIKNKSLELDKLKQELEEGESEKSNLERDVKEAEKRRAEKLDNVRDLENKEDSMRLKEELLVNLVRIEQGTVFILNFLLI
jgi:chromosome segregation ATPase